MTDEELVEAVTFPHTGIFERFAKTMLVDDLKSRLAKGRKAIEAMEKIVEALGTLNLPNRDCIGKICEIIIEWEAI